MNLPDLATRLEQATTGGKLRFSACSGQGWVAGANEATIRLLCDVWNNRLEIAATLRCNSCTEIPSSCDQRGR